MKSIETILEIRLAKSDVTNCYSNSVPVILVPADLVLLY